MIRVCHLITDLDVGGAENALLRLCRGLAPLGYQQHVVVMRPPGPIAVELERSGFPVRSLHMQSGRSAPIGLIKLQRELRTFAPDVLQTWLYHADLFGALTLSYMPRTRLLWNLRNTQIHDPRRFRTGGLVRSLAVMSRIPHAVIVNSRAGQEDHARLGYRPRRWACIPNGVDTGRFQPQPHRRTALRARLGVPGEGPLIGMIANHRPQKDHPTFLDAARMFSAARPDARFILAGHGAEPDAEPMLTMVRQRGLEDRVCLLGVRPDLPEIYPALDLVCLSSAFGEGTPNVLMEALACGIPCVATDVGDCRHIVGPCGRIVPPRDPAALSSGWAEVLELDLATAARDRAVNCFAESAVCSAYDSLYRSLIPRGHAGLETSPFPLARS